MSVNASHSGLENSTRPLVFTSASGCRTSEILIFLVKIYFFTIYANNFCDAGQVPILRYFEACDLLNNICSQFTLVVLNRSKHYVIKQIKDVS